MEHDELPKEEAEKRAREVAQRMLTTPKPKKDEASQRRTLEFREKKQKGSKAR